MGTALRNAVQNSKKTGKTLGGRGEGTQKETTIKRLQGYYHHSPVSNVPDIGKMRRAIMATSTNKKPNHSYCPTGKDSWCFFNKRKASKAKDKGNHDSMPIKLNETSFKVLLPLYKRLSSDELLSRCAKCANVCLHSCIWKKCPKQIFVCKPRLEYGITKGVGEFNMGCVALESLQDKHISKISLELAKRRDKKRIAQSSRQEESAAKQQRLQRKHGKKSKDSDIAGLV
ncbi:Nucleolar protein 9 [Frankliniella fusca]|uniref:Nucleolar protein 9 n=1 Tax=Frankliniella fusca TaxID=407009 RepID=A0AAE1HEP6_9NEOP|nr:Nucleolar protein 9 [Frankliniella fusca]